MHDQHPTYKKGNSGKTKIEVNLQEHIYYRKVQGPCFCNHSRNSGSTFFHYICKFFFPLIVKFLVRRDGNFFSTKCRHIREINWILKHNFEFSSIEAINIFMKNYILNVIGTTMCVSATIETALYRGTSLIGLVGTNVEAENINPVVDWFGRHMTSWYIVCYRVWLVTCFHSCLRCQMQQATVWLQRVWLYVCKTSIWLTVWTSRARPARYLKHLEPGSPETRFICVSTESGSWRPGSANQALAICEPITPIVNCFFMGVYLVMQVAIKFTFKTNFVS
jgi:hypothetical protein